MGIYQILFAAFIYEASIKAAKDIYKTSSMRDNRGFDLGKVIASLQGKQAFPMAASLSSIAELNECSDKSMDCPRYVYYCSQSYIQFYCKKTCGKCPTIPPITKDCSNKHPQCDANVKAGFCTGREDKVAYMRTYCKMGCKFCRPPPQPKSSKACGIATIRNRKNSGFESIVGGVNSVKGYFPWQVAIYYEGEFLCGGSLIDDKYVLSAAHCFFGIDDDVDNYLIVLGEYNRKNYEGTEQEVKVEKITMHENYKPVENQEDIAIVKLSEPAKMSDHIETICLPKATEGREVGSKCMISGWGKQSVFGDSVTILQELKVPVVGQKKCNARNLYSGRVITSRMMCTGYDNGYAYSSGCHGDSGGPLSCETKGGIWKLFGIVSWGEPQCNGLNMYTVYTKVNAYLPWIKKHTT